MADTGLLHVGVTDDSSEVVIVHPDLTPGSGQLLFSPVQARNLAELLIRYAHVCESREAKTDSE
jgi:hypothetical protein